MPELSDSQPLEDNAPQPDMPPTMQPDVPPGMPPTVPQSPAAAPAPKWGSNGLKFVLIFLGVLVGMGIIGSAILSFEFSHIAQSINPVPDGQANSDTPPRTMTADPSDQFTESDLGVPIYPGAQPVKGGMRMKFGDRTMITAAFLTADSKDQVIAFYKEKLGPIALTMMTIKGTEFVLNNNTGDSVTVTIFQDPAANDGKTQISIVHNSKA
jgi:hypothetical protein